MNENFKNQVINNNKKHKMTGFWVYCICMLPQGCDKLRICAQEGIQKGTKLHFLPFMDIDVSVSDIDLNEFDEIILKNKLKNDPRWTKESVELHHNTITKIWNNGIIIPMKFGTIFKTKENIEAMLKERYQEFINLLNQLKNKQEWGIKIYLDNERFIRNLKNKDDELKQLERRKITVPEGMKWYLDKKIDEILYKKIDNGKEEYLVNIIEKFKQYAEKIVINDNSDLGFNDQNRDMILNSACLIDIKQADTFQKYLEKLFKEYFENGFSAEITGPWPPYNFCEPLPAAEITGR